MLLTTTASAGIFYSGSNTLVHAYGPGNFFGGVGAGNLGLTGPANTSIGWQALVFILGGSNNPANGYQALYSTTNGYNITISLDDEVYRRARVKAAEQDTSVSALVKSYLVQLLNGASGQSEFARLATQEQMVPERLFAASKGLRAADNLPREALHDRDALR